MSQVIASTIDAGFVRPGEGESPLLGTGTVLGEPVEGNEPAPIGPGLSNRRETLRAERVRDMPTTVEEIDLWRLSPREHQRLEFKEAKTQFDSRKLLEYCVALANEGGGHLVLRVADKPPRPVVGTRAFADLGALAEQLLQTVGFRVDVEEVLHAHGRVLAFHIPSRPRGASSTGTSHATSASPI